MYAAAAAAKSLQSCPTVGPHRRQPTRLRRPWDSPGKNTGVSCHFFLQCVKVKLLSRVRLFATPLTAAYQAPPSMGFSRQEYWSRVPLPSPFLTYILSQIIKEREAFWSHMRCQIYIVLPFTSLEVIWIQGSWLTGAHNGILGGHDLLMPMCPTQRNSIQSQRKRQKQCCLPLFHWLCPSLWTYICVCVCVCVWHCTYICVWVTVPTCVCVAVPTSVCVFVPTSMSMTIPTSVCG